VTDVAWIKTGPQDGRGTVLGMHQCCLLEWEDSRVGTQGWQLLAAPAATIWEEGLPYPCFSTTIDILPKS